MGAKQSQLGNNLEDRLADLKVLKRIQIENFGSFYLAEFSEKDQKRSQCLIKEKMVQSLIQGRKIYDYCKKQKEVISWSPFLAVYGYSIENSDKAGGSGGTLAKIYLELFKGSLLKDVRGRRSSGKRFSERELLAVLKTGITVRILF